jgi:CO/xanthine dehydrogenase Mo-binding subunit
MLGVPWEQCEVVFGNTSKNLPWTCISAGSQTAHAMTRAAHAAATDAIVKLQEIAAKSLGGSPESYKVANGRVSNGGRSMTFAQAAQKAIELGGKYDGHELPTDVNNFTKKSAAGPRRPRSHGRRARRVSARRSDPVVLRRLRGSGSRPRNR